MDLLKRFISLSENFGMVSDFDIFEVDAEPNLEILSSKELEIYSKLTSLKRRNEFVSGRIACKKAFSKFTLGKTDCCEKFPSISVLNTKIGTPFIENSDHHVSIAHSHGIAIASVSQNLIGVDLEQIDLKRISALKRMSKESPSEEARELTVLWTLKESLGKYLQTGIIEEFEYYATKNFRCEDGIYYCEFQNFPFSGIAIEDERYAVSMVSM